MSLNKFKDYTKYTIIDGELKAKKLGLKEATDNKCCFISNTGDKQIIARDITPADLPGGGFTNGTFTLYTMIDPFVKSITPNVNADYYMIQQVSGSYQGLNSYDFRTMKAGDKISMDFYGHYTTPTGATEEAFRYVRLYFGSQFITWDAASQIESLSTFVQRPSVTANQSFKYRFQIVAKTDWNSVANSIDMVASGDFMSSSKDASFFPNTVTATAVYSLKNFTLTQSAMGRPDPEIINCLATSTFFPTAPGFVLYYEGMNYTITKGLYPVYP